MGYIEKRYFISLLSCLGFTFITLLEILSPMRIQLFTDEYSRSNNVSTSSISKIPFFIGKMTSLLGGIVSNYYGGARVFGLAMILSAGINLILESLLCINPVLCAVATFFDGAMQGLVYSSVADIWSRWTTLQDRSKYVSFTLTGWQLAQIYIGRFFSQKNNHFEFIAIWAAIWAMVWLLLVRNDPSQDESLSNTEKIILQERLKFLDEKSVALRQYPWLPILTSKSFWALNVAVFIKGVLTFIIYTILLVLPHISKLTGKPRFEAYENFMYLLIFTTPMIMGYIVDRIRKKNIITNNKPLKIFVCVSLVAQGIIFTTFNRKYYEDDPIIILLPFALMLIFRTSAEISIQTIVIDLSPRYSSLLNGIQNSFYTFGILCVELLPISIIFQEDSDFITSTPFAIAIVVLHFVGALLYYVFGSTTLQLWNGTSEDGQELEEYKNRTIVVE